MSARAAGAATLLTMALAAAVPTPTSPTAPARGALFDDAVFDDAGNGFFAGRAAGADAGALIAAFRPDPATGSPPELDLSRAAWSTSALPALRSRLALVGPPNDLVDLRNDAHGYARFAREESGRRSVLLAIDGAGALRGWDAGRRTPGGRDGGTGSQIFEIAPAGNAPAPSSSRGDIAFADAFLDAPWAGGGARCPPEVSEAGAHCAWRTLAVAARGDASLLVVDVTRPDAAVRVRELTDAEDADANGRPDLAPLSAAPALGRVRLRGVSGRPEEHAVAIFGGGADPANRSGNWIYFVDPATGAVLYKGNHGVAATAAGAEKRWFGSIPAGVSAVDLDEDGFLDAVYFGDANGQLFEMRMPAADALLPALAAAPGGAPARIQPREETPGAPWVPTLVFDGTAGEQGRSLCAKAPKGAAFTGCPAWAAISEAPSVFVAGRDRLGRALLAVAFGTAGAASGEPSRIVVVFQRSGAAPRTAASVAAIPDPSAKELAACGTAGALRADGWSLRLVPGERLASPLLTLRGYLYFTAATAAGPRLYRLDGRTGDSCAGADCCAGSSAAWGVPGAVDRGAGFAAAGLPSRAGVPFARLDDAGRLRLSLLLAVPRGGGVVSRLHDVPIANPARLRNVREP